VEESGRGTVWSTFPALPKETTQKPWVPQPRQPVSRARFNPGHTNMRQKCQPFDRDIRWESPLSNIIFVQWISQCSMPREPSKERFMVTCLTASLHVITCKPSDGFTTKLTRTPYGYKFTTFPTYVFSYQWGINMPAVRTSDVKH
jgi:hypothetical protein